jgi:hypothetical protein
MTAHIYGPHEAAVMLKYISSDLVDVSRRLDTLAAHADPDLRAWINDKFHMIDSGLAKIAAAKAQELDPVPVAVPLSAQKEAAE